MKFEDAVQIILEHEGGYVLDPRDPGGETNFGISKRAYPNIDIKRLSREYAIQIYKRDYWDVLQCDLLPHALRLIVFDCAVNQGAGFAAGTLQACIGAKVDGLIGPITLKELQKANAAKVLDKYAFFRLRRYAEQKTFAIYGFGWIKRLLSVSLKSSLYLNLSSD